MGTCQPIAACDIQVWSTNQVEGVHRFLARSYRLVTGENVTENEPSKEQLRSLHIAIKRVTSHPNSNVCARMLPTQHSVRNLTARSVIPQPAYSPCVRCRIFASGDIPREGFWSLHCRFYASRPFAHEVLLAADERIYYLVTNAQLQISSQRPCIICAASMQPQPPGRHNDVSTQLVALVHGTVIYDQ